MAYVVTRLCRDCKDFACLDYCPKDCILEHQPASGLSELPNQVFIDPDECIDCNACVPACPWEAIYAEEDVPAALAPDIELNALVRTHREEFGQPKQRGTRTADADAIDENHARWGLSR